MNEANTGANLPQEQVQPQVTPAAEPLVPQHRVNEIVSDAHKRGYEKAMREAQMQQPQAPQAPQLSPEDIARIAREETLKAHQQALAEQMKQQQLAEAVRVQNDVESKLQATKASGRYPDFDEKIKSLGLDKMPALIWHASTVDNPGDVLYDLADNPAKIAMLNALPPHLIPGEIQKLSNSIKANQKTASDLNLPPDPLRPINPSAGVGVDKRPSERTASEWRNIYKGRF